MLTKQLVLVLVLTVTVCVVFSKKCDKYKGKPCKREYYQTMINTENCERECVMIFPEYDCARACSEFSGPTCTDKQVVRSSSCSCTSTCIDVLGEGEQCNDTGSSFCKGNLNCVDGVCAV